MNVGIILAAGESRRMGKPKQLLPFNGRTILECVIDALNSPKIDEVLVVLGHRANEIESRIRHTCARTVLNKLWSRGMFTSVQDSLRALPSDPELILIALCDQPRLRRETVNRLVNDFSRGHHKIVIPVYNGRQGHPLLFSGRYIKEILAMDEAMTLKHFLAGHPHDIKRVVVDDEGVLVDIDDEKTYHRELKKWAVQNSQSDSPGAGQESHGGQRQGTTLRPPPGGPG